jgi:hypothetical protein
MSMIVFFLVQAAFIVLYFMGVPMTIYEMAIPSAMYCWVMLWIGFSGVYKHNKALREGGGASNTKPQISARLAAYRKKCIDVEKK